VRAVVLVGGEGTRLRPLTYTTPKQLLPIVETPMIERVLGYLSGHGIEEAVLSLGYQPEAFTRRYPDGRAADVDIHYAVEPEPLDTAGAIRFAALDAGIEETFVVLNGDVLTDGDLSALIEFHRDVGALATIYLSPVEDPSRFGVVPTDHEGKVLEFVEKPPADEAPTNLINAGVYVLEPEVIDRIAEGRRVSVERETFPALASEGVLYARSDGAYWLDTGTPEAYLQAQCDLLSGARGEPPADGAVRGPSGAWEMGATSVAGTVDRLTFVGVGAIVEVGASVAGSVVGAGCFVESRAAVRGSVLLPGAHVGSGAVVDGSIVGAGARIGRSARLTGISIVGEGFVVPDGFEGSGERLSDSQPSPSR
jgi:mannose-1-phosphate guanylyltransferase